MSGVELKRCPCCGGEAHFRTETVTMAGHEYQAGYVICMDCGMRTRSAPMDGFTGVDWTEEDFAALWNRRAGEEDGGCVLWVSKRRTRLRQLFYGD